MDRATHNMYAYRIYDQERDIWFQDNDDDGESAAGKPYASFGRESKMLIN